MNEKLLEAAKSYHEQGYVVVPFVIDPTTQKKVPDTLRVPKWSQWQTQPQTNTEFDKLHIEEYAMFGVLCGTPIEKDGEIFYFVGIDRDVKDPEISATIKDSTLKALNEMKPYTHREKTRSGGQHLCFLSRTPVETKSLNKIGMELIGQGKFLIMSPSEGYNTENDNDFSIVQDAGKIFYSALEIHGLFKNNQVIQPINKTAPLRPCFEKLMKKPHLEHLEKVALIYEMFYSGMTQDQITQVFQEHQAWEPAPEHTFDPKKTADQLRYTLNKAKEGNFRYRAETLAGPDLQMCYPECPLSALNDCRKLHPTIEELEKTSLTIQRIRKGDFKDYETPEDAFAWFIATLYSFDFSVREVKDALENLKNETWNKYSEYTKKIVFGKVTKIQQAEEAKNEENKEQESQADRIYKLFVENSNIQLFHDQNKTEYARIPLLKKIDDADDVYDVSASPRPLINSPMVVDNNKDTLPPTQKLCESTVTPSVPSTSKEIVKLSDKRFSEYLSHLLWEAEGKLANTDAKNQAICLLNYDASHGKFHRLFNRVAPDPKGNGIWLDTADNQNRAYHITKEGWTIETDVPILFKREEHQLPLAIAEKNGDVKLLLPFVNIGANKSSETTKLRQLLLLVQTASYLIPDISKPINAMFGCPGTHKSWVQRFIAEIFDNSTVPWLRIPKDETAAIQVLDHHYIPIFDNISSMPTWLSDILCGATTGAGQESRALYTNDDPFIRSFKRCVMLNGVNLPEHKGDLLSRTILHPTEPTENRLTDKELLSDYHKVLPYILGGFLNVIVLALKIIETEEAKPTKLFRLADFTEWGCAITLALGETKEDFIKAMDENLASQNTADIEGNVVADAFIAYCQMELGGATEQEPEKLKPSELYNKVKIKAEVLGINTKSKRWPQAPNQFTRKLNESKNAIVASGWNYEVEAKGKTRQISIWNTKPEPPEPIKEFCYKICGNYDLAQCPKKGNITQVTEYKGCQNRVPKVPQPKKRYVCDSCGMIYQKKPAEGYCQNKIDEDTCGGLLTEEEF